MASRPAESAGPRKLRTYGGLSRSRTSTPSKIRQSRTPILSTAAKLAQSSNACLSRGKSVESPGPDNTNSPPILERSSTETSANIHGVGRKRKRPILAMLDERPDYELGDFLERDSKSADLTSRKPSTGSSLVERDYSMEIRRAVAENTSAAGGTAMEDDFKISIPRRRRLIDALTTPECTRANEIGRSAYNESPEASEREADSAERIHAVPDARSGTGNRRSTPISRKVRLTYSQSRTSGESQALEASSPLPAVSMDDSVLPDTQMRSSPIKDQDTYNIFDDPDPQPAIRSVHELRRSGAINRHADEMDDLLIRVGKPGTGSLATRRTALCELAQRLPRDGFAEQFRDHNCRDKVAIDIGEEDDVVCGFALAAALVIFLKSNSAPHLVRQLTRQGLGRFLGRLLRVDDDIDLYTARRHTKLSRMLAASLHEVKHILVEMSIWHGHAPLQLSPRTLSLRLLETISRCSEGQLLQQVANDLGRDLAIVAAGMRTSEILDYALTVFALEVLSGSGISMVSDKAEFSKLHLPRSIFSFLRAALRNWPSERHELGSAVMKLAINTTNTEDGAAAFKVADLSLLADRIGRGFDNVKQAIDCGVLENSVYDDLLLMLGVMINVMEHSHRARTSVDKTALDKIAKLWEDNQPTISEANLVDKSKLSVAVNYLAVLLGYLCLTTRGRARVNTQVGSLVISIRQFVDMCRAVDSRTKELESLATELYRQI
ncbi:hypothetical protein L249_5523, partial [Ophiocordyceps polyrhachis-furcata BCC 54312]